MLLAAGHEVIGLVRSQPAKALPWKTTVTDLSSISSIVEATKGCVAIVHSGIANDFNKHKQKLISILQKFTHSCSRLYI